MATRRTMSDGGTVVSIAQLRSHKRVEHIDDERASGNGIIVTLKKGWSFDPFQDNRVAGEDTPSLALTMIMGAKPFGGPYDE